MKKTFSILLASACAAMAATEVSYTPDPVTGAYSLTNADGVSQIDGCNVTVAYTFNSSFFQNFVEDYTYPFTLNGTYAPNKENPSAEGMLLDKSGNNYILKYTAKQVALEADPGSQTWRYKNLSGYESLKTATFDLTSIQALSIVLTVEHSGSGNGTAYGYVYALDNNNTVHKYYGYYTGTNVNTTNITLLEYDESITGSLKVYNGTMSMDEAEKLGMSLITVPEPTTATLSLLALAGLAARRRRA